MVTLWCEEQNIKQGAESIPTHYPPNGRLSLQFPRWGL